MKAARIRNADHLDNSDICPKRPRIACVPCENKVDLAEACQEYRNQLIDKWCKGTLNNIDLCTDAWYHTRSNGGGVEDLALNPFLRGANHARKVRDAFKLDNIHRHLFRVRAPVYDKTTGKRIYIKLFFAMPSISHRCTRQLILWITRCRITLSTLWSNGMPQPEEYIPLGSTVIKSSLASTAVFTEQVLVS